MIPDRWKINCLKMYKISNEVIQFIEKTMETWKVELTAGGKRLAEAKIQKGIFQGDSLSPLLFVIAMMLLKHFLRKCRDGYKLSKSQEKINYQMYTTISNCLRKTKKNWNPKCRQWEYTVRIYSRDRIWHRKMRHACNEKWQTTYNGMNGTTKSRKIRTLGERET